MEDCKVSGESGNQTILSIHWLKKIMAWTASFHLPSQVTHCYLWKGGWGTGTIHYVFLLTTGRVTSVRLLWTSLRNSSSLPLSFCVDDRWSGQEFALASFLWGFYCYYLLVLHIHGCLSSMCWVLSVVSRLRKWELGGGKAATPFYLRGLVKAVLLNWIYWLIRFIAPVVLRYLLNGALVITVMSMLLLLMEILAVVLFFCNCILIVSYISVCLYVYIFMPVLHQHSSWQSSPQVLTGQDLAAQTFDGRFYVCEPLNSYRAHIWWVEGVRNTY